MTSASLAPIQHLVVLVNPSPASFNHSVATAYCDAVRACGQEAVLRDLYAMGFDPVLKAAERPDLPDYHPAPDVARELVLLRGCSVIALVYPIWFGMPPAMLKGYVDRVLGAGFATGRTQPDEPHPLLHGKRMMIFTTSGTGRPWLEAMGQWQALRHAFDNYLRTIFTMKRSDHVHFDAVTSGLKKRYAKECLARVDAQARKICSEVLSEQHARRRQAIRENALV
jgi:NAD(P)H dehydrogenase (quinone)